ncbi:MAG: SusC/RagA family TonB-linked outer membrane protein [Mucilaginibacter sp.]|uniref:SusC/RagA family TonB-linked outer membrane protein n=1 Tax=Mucilaginibacter sp. TaxID=1882438 RepID=UPI0034E389EB
MIKKLLHKKLPGKKLSLGFLFAIFTFYSSYAQDRQITGKVTAGDDGSNLPGVSVQVKGTTTGTVTAANGTYAVSAPANATLVFSFIGYTRQEIAVANRSVINIRLPLDNTTLKEVNVVSVGYGTQRRKDLTGSVSSVTAEQIAKTPVTTLDQAIQGRSAGVQVTNNDGAPGGGVQIQIRGIGSFGTNEPLYVIDGYPVTTGLGSINQNDIASIDILKDASATAIYGNRAANGVVIITTKRGRKDGVDVSIDALTSVQSQPKMYNVLTAQQFATLAVQRSAANLDNFQAQPEWSNPASLRNIDWQKALYKTGLKQNYNFAIRGGNEKVQAAFSAGILDQKGIVLGSDFKRYNAGLNVDYTALKWLRSSTSLKYTRSDSKISFGTGGQNAGLGIGSLTKLIPTITGNKLTDQVKDANGNYGFYNPTNQFISYLANPVYAVETQDQKNPTNYFLGTTSLEATIFDGLKIKTNLGVNTNDYSGYYFTPSDTRTVDQYGQAGTSVLSYFSQNANNTFDVLWENTLSYSKTFGAHSIDFVGGVSEQKNTFRRIGVSGNGSVSDALRTVQGITTATNLFGDETNTALASQFARLNYKFMDKYLITGTVRRDGSSRFAPGHQYGVFPSGSVAWRVKNESFLKDVQSVYDLKIRASYGSVGNQLGINPFQYLSQYTSGGAQASADNVGYPFNKIYQPGLVLAALPNPNLKWETSRQTDIGFDLGLLGGNLNVTVDYYRKDSRDFLLQIPVPAQTGFTTAARNVGSVRNSGLEFNVEYRESKAPFKYGIGLNLTTVNNKLLTLADGLDAVYNFSNLGLPNVGGNTWTVFSQSKVGGPIGAFYGFKSAGIFQNQAQIDALNAGTVAKNGANTFYQSSATQPGDRKFVDVDGDGRITDADRVQLGSPIPKFFTGLNLDASYKQFDFNAFFYASVGNKIFNYAERTLETFGATQGGIGIENISQQYLANAWTPSNPSNRYARITKADDNGNTRPSDVYVEDGSFLKLKNLQIGYTLPVALAKSIALSRIRLYVSAQNLFVITKYTGLDPEIGQVADPGNGARSVTTSGIDVGTYPSSRFYTLGLNVTF